MYSIKRVISGADPMGPPPESAELSPRAEAELRELVPERRPLRRPYRRALGMAGAAAVPLIAAGAVGFVILRDDAAPPPTANQAVYSGTDVLEGRADMIVRATVRAMAAQNDEGVPETVATVEVSRVAKGDTAAGRRLAVAYTTPGPDVAEAPKAFVVGREYVFLLTSPDAADQTHMVNTFQGWYAVDGTQIVADEQNPVELSPSVLARLGLR